jgi:hypothetical protein
MAKVEDLLISDFYTKALAVDFARDNHFRVTDIVPTPSLGISFDANELIYARSAKVPARNITNVEAKYMGMTFNLPGIAEYPESASYTLEFYVDKNSSIRNKFEQWSRAIFNDGTSTGNYSVPGRDAYIELTQVDAQFEAIQKYKLVGVSIRSVGDVSYEIAEGTGAVKTFSVTMAYHYYELDNTGVATGGLDTVGP